MANCYAETSPQIQPAMRLISAVTNADPASITTTFAHGYVTGTIVRISVPSYYGMNELNGLDKVITVTGNTTFTIDVDTRKYKTFAAPVARWYHNKCAIVIPIGEISSILTAAVQDVT